LLASSSQDGTVSLWNAETPGQLVKQLDPKHGDEVRSVAFSPPDGRYLATGSFDRKVRLWNGQTGERVREIPNPEEKEELSQGHKDRIVRVAFSPDGKLLATASEDGTAKLWDTESGRFKRTFLHKEDSNRNAPQVPLSGVTFSPDGEYLATTNVRGSVTVYNVSSGRIQYRLPKHSGAVNGAVFTPKGNRLITVSTDETAKVWDLAEEEAILTLPSLRGSVNCIAMSPSGKLFATATFGKQGGSIVQFFTEDVYNVNPNILKKYADKCVTRDLTAEERRTYLPPDQVDRKFR
jgi:WD40 repeat protein